MARPQRSRRTATVGAWWRESGAKISSRAAVVLLVTVAALGTARADEPLRPPNRYTVCSPSKQFCVTSDPRQGTFAHTPDRPGVDEARWRIPRWFRVLYASDDPDLLVTGYDGSNLVPVEAPATVEILAFWRHGKLVRAYKLAELVDVRRLRPTASHFYWGDYQGFDADGLFRLATVEGKVLVFAPTTGKLVRERRAPER
jgi:hypothetical protein